MRRIPRPICGAFKSTVATIRLVTTFFFFFSFNHTYWFLDIRPSKSSLLTFAVYFFIVSIHFVFGLSRSVMTINVLHSLLCTGFLADHSACPTHLNYAFILTDKFPLVLLLLLLPPTCQYSHPRSYWLACEEFSSQIFQYCFLRCCLLVRSSSSVI